VTSVVVYGASGHGSVVADAWSAVGPVVGYIDDDRSKWGQMHGGLPVLGGFEQAVAAGLPVALGIGVNSARQAVAKRIQAKGLTLATVVHPSAVVARSATLGAGAVVFAQAVVNPGARIGEGAIVNSGAVVEHDCWVGEYAHVSPGAALGGAARLGALAHLGINGTILPLVEVGAGSIVGGGATVVHSIGEGLVVVGTPARPLSARKPS
jgi:sugar O-acyltransferase (sialic acid O-acetyltransferase NeuD family)